MNDFGINNSPSKELQKYLAGQEFIEQKFDLSQILNVALKYASRYFKPKVELGVTVDPNSGLHTFTGKIMPGEPDNEQLKQGYISVDRLGNLAEEALAEADFQIWVLLDRLDVAFAETHELEKNALRALFRGYRDFAAHDHVSSRYSFDRIFGRRLLMRGLEKQAILQKMSA
jgi:hypothetical protein